MCSSKNMPKNVEYLDRPDWAQRAEGCARRLGQLEVLQIPGLRFTPREEFMLCYRLRA
jgi:hypothetical protein